METKLETKLIDNPHQADCKLIGNPGWSPAFG